MRWLQRLIGRLRAPKPLPAPERRRLEDWVRLRFRLEPADPMTAIIAASGRLKEAGMDADEAVETVLRIMKEVDAELER